MRFLDTTSSYVKIKNRVLQRLEIPRKLNLLEPSFAENCLFQSWRIARFLGTKKIKWVLEEVKFKKRSAA